MTAIPDPRSLGPTLRRIRRTRGMTPAQLAQKSGYSLSSIYQWERGINAPLFSALITWLDSLDLELHIVRKDQGTPQCPTEAPTGEAPSEAPSAAPNQESTATPATPTSCYGSHSAGSGPQTSDQRTANGRA